MFGQVAPRTLPTFPGYEESKVSETSAGKKPLTILANSIAKNAIRYFLLSSLLRKYAWPSVVHCRIKNRIQLFFSTRCHKSDQGRVSNLCLNCDNKQHCENLNASSIRRIVFIFAKAFNPQFYDPWNFIMETHNRWRNRLPIIEYTEECILQVEDIWSRTHEEAFCDFSPYSRFGGYWLVRVFDSVVKLQVSQTQTRSLQKWNIFF